MWGSAVLLRDKPLGLGMTESDGADTELPGIPDDFPVRAKHAALSGAHPKLALVRVGGRYYQAGQTPEQVRADYEMCEDLAHQLVPYCRRKMAEGVVQTTDAALERALLGLKHKLWCSAEQNAWIVRRTAALLGWQVPQSIPPSVGRLKATARE